MALRSVYTQILIQPRSRGLRFRYECEGRSAGAILGANSTPEQKTYPTIKIHNYDGPAVVVVVSCVTTDEPPRPHPHSVVNKECKKGVFTTKVKRGNTKEFIISFPNIGIQCAKKKEIKAALDQRQEIKVNPYGTTFDHNSIDLNVVRLCFQVFLCDINGVVNGIVPPVSSDPIYDKKTVNDLMICRLSKQAGYAQGGEEVFLLCEKVQKDDIQVRFFRTENGENNGEPTWEDYGHFGQQDVHRQTAIVFKIPPYEDMYITQPVTVFLQLKRASDGETSDAKQFTYIPSDPDPDGLEYKRKVKKSRTELGMSMNNDPMASGNFGAVTQHGASDIKARLKASINKRRGIQGNETCDIENQYQVSAPYQPWAEASGIAEDMGEIENFNMVPEYTLMDLLNYSDSQDPALAQCFNGQETVINAQVPYEANLEDYEGKSSMPSDVERVLLEGLQ